MWHSLKTLVLRVLPLPIHRPGPPEHWLCHPDYGQNIVPLDCQMAVDDNWPSGKLPVQYSSGDPSPSNGVRVPQTNSHGTCRVSLETAGPDFSPPGFFVPPNHMRALAGFIIETCAGQSAGIGGFVTYGFGTAQNYVANSNNTLVEDMLRQASGMRADGNYLTIAISASNDYEFQPGDTDPAIATYLSNYAANLSSLYTNPAQFRRRFFFMEEARRLRDRAINMVRGGNVSWWFDLDLEDLDGPEDEMSDTATSPPSNSPDGKDQYDGGKMTYLCDADLGSPRAVDCEKLAWSGLKAPDTIEILKPETPNIYTSGSCALGISSPVATSISWAHLLSAFETLNSFCVQNPIQGVKGGRAFYGTQSVSSWINGKRDGVGGVNGSEALPVGINATVWKHDTQNNSDLKCEWQLAMEGKDVNDCAVG